MIDVLLDLSLQLLSRNEQVLAVERVLLDVAGGETIFRRRFSESGRSIDFDGPFKGREFILLLDDVGIEFATVVILEVPDV